MMKDDHDIQRFEALLGRFEHAMLVSIADDDSLHARPMAIADNDGAVLRFVTSRDTAKAAEMKLRPGVSVVMQGDGAYLAISGTARIINDPVRVKLLWRSAWKDWFPGGPNEPGLVLVEIDPERAEYWDRAGARRLEFLREAGKALATGRRMTEEEFSGHGKFTFG